MDTIVKDAAIHGDNYTIEKNTYLGSINAMLMVDTGAGLLGKFGKVGKAAEVEQNISKVSKLESFSNKISVFTKDIPSIGDKLASFRKFLANKLRSVTNEIPSPQLVRDSMGNTYMIWAKKVEGSGGEIVKSEKVVNGASKADIVSKALNDSKTALEEHIKYIKNGGVVKPTGGKFAPSKVSAIVDTKTGKIYYGYSGKVGFNPSRAETVHKELQKLIERTKDLARRDVNNPYAEKASFERWDVDNCAEIQAVNQALNDEVKIEDMFIRTVNFKTGEFADFCKNCRTTFAQFMKASE
ncbi:hypothetical protein [Clostridium felsineum]|uniref:hypothetical protein n=1 Tax=Clostridium felsineum TaxID=36839 RepID=UPI00098BF49A|nr:hypothetical protein [Clostridium felsineum]URZ03165.1 hypothetical protein CLAUR_032110 [Clostridium felsineum]